MGVPLYRKIESELEDRIRNGGLSPGEVLPSENELCAQYTTSRKTIRSALKELMKDGLVRNMAGIGWKVISQEGEFFLDGRPAALLSRAHANLSLLNRRFREKTEKAGGVLRYIPAEDEDADEFFSIIESEQPAGIFIIYHSWMDQDFVEQLHRLPCPVVLIRYQGGAGNVDSVDIDNYSSGRMLIDLLFQNGHRRILLLPSLSLCEHYSSLSLSLAGSRDRASRLGMVFREIGCRYNNWLVPSDSERMLNVFEKMKREGNIPTAAVCSTANAASALILALQGAGIRVPDDVSVVCTGAADSFPELKESGISRITSIIIPWEKLADISFSMFINRIRGESGEPAVHLISPELEKGDTLRTIKQETENE